MVSIPTKLIRSKFVWLAEYVDRVIRYIGQSAA